MKTHMMGVGMAFIGTILMPALSPAPTRTTRGLGNEAGYRREKRAEAVGGDTWGAMSMPATTPVLAEQLMALIPQEETIGAGRPMQREEGERDAQAEALAELQTDAQRALEWIGKSGLAVTETETDKTGIFCFRETEEGTFELRELSADSGARSIDAKDWAREIRKPKMHQAGQKSSLIERIRSL